MRIRNTCKSLRNYSLIISMGNILLRTLFLLQLF